MTERKYLPTFADLVDRLSIVLLKQIFIPEFSKEYAEERKLIEDDLESSMMDRIAITGKEISAILLVMLANRTIWENEAEARKGGRRQNKLLKFTHSINGVRNRAKNAMAGYERRDRKVDCFAADLPPEFGNWNVFDD